MESPFRARSDMGARRSISAILSRFIRKRVCAFANPPIYLTQYLLIGSKLIVTKSEKFLCWMLQTLIISTLSWAISGHFSWLADGPAFCHGWSAVQNFNPNREPAICVSQAKTPADSPAFNRGQSAVDPKSCTRTLPETCCSASFTGGQSANMSRTVRSRLIQFYTEPTQNLELSAF